MSLATRLHAILTKHEGSRAYVYDDATGLELRQGMTIKGHPTIGVGRCIERGHGELSADEISLLLDHDIDRCIKSCEWTWPWFATLDEARQAVFVSMVFNMGMAGVLKFKEMLAAVERQDYAAAKVAGLDSLWAKQVGRRATDLMDLLEHGDPPPTSP